jgi:MFS transporter, ACS family, hexuronate transporter
MSAAGQLGAPEPRGGAAAALAPPGAKAGGQGTAEAAGGAAISAEPGKVAGLRWFIAALLTFITVIIYLDRGALGVVGPTLKKELAIDEKQFSYVVIGFQILYGLSQPFAGRFIDWLNLRFGFFAWVAWWSLVQGLTGFAGGLRSLVALRGALGMGEAGNFPGAIKAVSCWFPPSERTIATGIINMGSALGQLLAPPVVVFCILHSGWRSAFLLTGALGAIWAVVWFFFYRAPEEHPRLSRAEYQHIKHSEPEPCAPAAGDDSEGVTRLVLRSREFWAVGLARFLSEPAWQLFTYWIPYYLVSQRHLDLKQIAWFGWVPFLAADLGSLFGGFLSPFFLKLGLPVMTARKLAVTVPASFMLCSALIGTVPSAGMAVLLFSVGAFAHQAISATLLTLPADLFPKRAVATANGLSGMLGYTGGILFTWVVGRLAGASTYQPLFFAIAVFDLLGSLFLWWLLRKPAPPALEVA